MRLDGPGFLNLLRWELVKLARRRASYVGFVLCGAFCVSVLIGFSFARWKGLRYWGRALPVDPAKLIEGPFFANFVLLVGFFALMPLLAATLGGSQIAGEARDGTLRTVLVRPVGRLRLYAAKVIATYLWLQLILLFLVGLALVIGTISLGGDRLLVFVWELRQDGVWLVELGDWAWLLALVTLGAGASLFVVASLAIMLSAMTDTPAAAHVGSLGAFLISAVLQRLPVEIMPDEFRELLPTTHMGFWQELYRLTHPSVAFDAGRFVTDIAWCVVTSGVFLAVGAIAFRRRDITT